MTRYLSHIWNPLRDSPGFTVPLFQADKNYFMQDVEDRRVRGFTALELESDTGLRRAQESIVVCVGDEEFVSFMTIDKVDLMGFQRAIKEVLRATVKEYVDRPFLFLEIAQFIEDETLEKVALERLSQIELDLAPETNLSQWRKHEPFAAKSVETAGLEPANPVLATSQLKREEHKGAEVVPKMVRAWSELAPGSDPVPPPPEPRTRSPIRTAKRIILLLDGTWNDIDVGPYDTNIVRMRELISCHLVRISDHGRARHDESNKKVHGYSKAGKEHIIYYERGVGTGAFDRFKGGAFGEGLSTNIRHAYKFLSFWYEPGDEIFIYGFSRGAYTARSLVGYLGAAGLLCRDTCNEELEALAWRYYRTPPNDRMPADWRRLTDYVHDRDEVRVKLIGVFDTVGALGIPFSQAWRLNRDENGFHDVELSSITDVNLHALAIDEHRWPFEATLWRMPPFKKYDAAVEQVWFSGAHADVGGGYIVEESRDSKAAYADDITLDWMIRRTKHFYPNFPFDLDPNAEKIAEKERASLHNSRRHVYRVWPFAIRSIANCKTGANFWRRQTEVSRDRHARPIGEMVHISALERFLPGKSMSPAGEKYKAANLDKVIDGIRQAYEPTPGGRGAPARSDSSASGSIFELPVVDWNGQTITSRCSRAEYLRGLLARRAEHSEPDRGLGSLSRAFEALRSC